MATLSGRCLVPRATTARLTGTVTLEAEPVASVTGTVTLSRAMADACLAPERHVRCLVYLGIGGAWVLADGLTGTVEWGRSRNVVTDWARFTIADSRTARFHASSVAKGGVPVRIDLRVRSHWKDATKTVFVGRTLSSSNEGAMTPTATYRAEGLAGAWGKAGRRASVRQGALSGGRRGAVLKAWAQAAGLSTVGMVIPDGGSVPKAVDLVSVTGQALLDEFALVEGWSFRPRTDGTIEILEAGFSAGASRFDFTPETTDSAPLEQLPDRPVTYYTLTGTTIDESKLGQRQTVTANAATPSGTAQVSITYEGDVEVFRTWREGSQLEEKRHEIVTEWNRTADGLPTGQMSRRRHVVTGWVNPECAVALGVLCWDGRYHLTQAWAWQLESEVLEELTWGDCSIERKTTTTRRFYAPLGFRSNPPDDCLRQDGTYRSVEPGQTTDALIEVAKEIVDYETDGSETAKRVEVWGWVPDGYENAVGPPSVDTAKERYWIANVLVGAQAQGYSGVSSANGGALAAAGQGSGAPRANATEPQHKTKPMQLTFEVADSGFPYREASMTIAGAQTLAELQVAAEVLSEEGLGTRYALQHAGIVGLEPADPVTITGALKRDSETGTAERVRALVAKAARVDDISCSVDVKTGAFDQKTSVLVPWRKTR